MDKPTLGQLIDQYTDGKSIEALYLYRDKRYNPHIVLTESEQDYDYTEVFSKDIDLSDQVKLKRGEVEALQAKISQLKQAEKEVIKAIKLLKES